MATHYSILAWKIKWTKQAGGPQFTWSPRVGGDLTHRFFTIRMSNNEF